MAPNWNQLCITSQENRQIFFGGTDEQPFLVQLYQQSLEVLFKEGVKGFYQSLIPKKLLYLAKKFNLEFKRQGDIFAIPFPWPLEKLSKQRDQMLKKINELL